MQLNLVLDQKFFLGIYIHYTYPNSGFPKAGSSDKSSIRSMNVVTKPKPVFLQPKLLPQKSVPKSAAQTHNFQNGSLRNKLCPDLLGTRIEPRKSTIRIKIGTYSVRLSFGVFLTITNSILRADTSSPAILSLKSLISIFKSANQITSKMGTNLNRFPKILKF